MERRPDVGWVLLAVVVLGAIGYLLARGSSRPVLDDECPLDRLIERREREARARPPAAEETAPPPPAPEDAVAPALRESVRKLSSALPLVAAEGAKELGESGHPDAALPLVRALRSEQRSVLFAAVEGLLRLGTPAVGPLQAALDAESDPEVRGLLGRAREELDRRARGLPPAPLDEVVGASARHIDEVGRGWSKD
jgi:hypothetical protein